MSDEGRTESLRRERKRFFWKLDGEILFSDAFKEIARDGQTVTTYLLILSRQPLPPNKRDRLRLEKAGLWPPKDTSFSFPLREAHSHGLTVRGLAHGLRRLHEVGIIDRIRAGSALKGDFALYRLSERWRHFGKPTFEAIPWPKADTIGRRGEGGKFIRRRGRKNLVVAHSTTTKAPLMANMTTTTPPVVVESTINTCGKPRSVVAESTMLLSSPSLDLESGKVGKKVQGKESGNSARTRRHDAAPSNGKLKLSDLRKHVADILERNLPEGSVRNVNYISSQLWDVAKGRLDPEKVRASIKLTVAYMPDTIINTIMADLFTLIGHSTKAKIRFAKPKVIPWMGSPAETAALLATWGPM